MFDQPGVGVGQGPAQTPLTGILPETDQRAGADVVTDVITGQQQRQELFTGQSLGLGQETATQQVSEFVTPAQTVTENLTESSPAAGFGTTTFDRPRSPDPEEDNRDEEEYLLDEDAALFGSGITSGQQAAEDVFGDIDLSE